MAKYDKLMLRRGQVRTAIAATKKLNQLLPDSAPVDTVRRGLREVGMDSEKVVKKPELKKKHTRQSKLFTKKYREWTVDDWARVIFSDESKFNRLSSDGLCYRLVN